MTKRHLVRAGVTPHRRAACGLREPARWTNDPEQVTCRTCRGSLYMADLEIRMTQPAPTRRSRRKDSKE